MEFKDIKFASDVSLLQTLHMERRKSSSSKPIMNRICSELVQRGVYPKYGNAKYRYPALKMVLNYGVDWHQFSSPHYCEHCEADLRDWEAGPPFKKAIGFVEDDVLQYYLCPHCSGKITNIIVGTHTLEN
jgi:hypothetical protein